MNMFKLDGNKKEDAVTKTFRIPVSLAARLEELAGKKDLSVNKIVVKCIRYALDNLDE